MLNPTNPTPVGETILGTELVRHLWSLQLANGARVSARLWYDPKTDARVELIVRQSFAEDVLAQRIATEVKDRLLAEGAKEGVE
jgi:hypothetical protein